VLTDLSLLVRRGEGARVIVAWLVYTSDEADYY
jgi:hypothetical protein